MFMMTFLSAKMREGHVNLAHTKKLVVTATDNIEKSYVDHLSVIYETSVELWL